jgi:hypothetical protein
MRHIYDLVLFEELHTRFQMLLQRARRELEHARAEGHDTMYLVGKRDAYEVAEAMVDEAIARLKDRNA